MKKALGLVLLTYTTIGPFQNQTPQQTFSGTLSDSMCGASHQMMAAAGKMSDRDCVFECIKALAKYVLVDDKQQVIPIANQDLAGLPFHTGRRVRITGELERGAIVAAKVEALPAQ